MTVSGRIFGLDCVVLMPPLVWPTTGVISEPA